MPVEENSPLGSVDKALRALQVLGEAGAAGLTLSQLARHLALNKGSLHRTLSALRHRGFVDQDDQGHYRLGTSILGLADSYLRQESLRRIFHDGLEALCVQIQETCHLGVLIDDQIMYIDKVEPQRAIRIWSELGWRNPAICTALGRAILSQTILDFESFAARFSLPAKRNLQSHTTMRSIWQELLAARRRGFAIEEQENEPGVTCIGVTILRDTEAVAAFSITTPSDRMNEGRAVAVIKILRDCIAPHLPPGFSLQRPSQPVSQYRASIRNPRALGRSRSA